MQAITGIHLLQTIAFAQFAHSLIQLSTPTLCLSHLSISVPYLIETCFLPPHSQWLLPPATQQSSSSNQSSSKFSPPRNTIPRLGTTVTTAKEPNTDNCPRQINCQHPNSLISPTTPPLLPRPTEYHDFRILQPANCRVLPVEPLVLAARGPQTHSRGTGELRDGKCIIDTTGPGSHGCNPSRGHERQFLPC